MSLDTLPKYNSVCSSDLLSGFKMMLLLYISGFVYVYGFYSAFKVFKYDRTWQFCWKKGRICKMWHLKICFDDRHAIQNLNLFETDFNIWDAA